MRGVYELTVNSGEDIKETIVSYILEQKWEEAYISGAIGSSSVWPLPRPLRISCL